MIWVAWRQFRAQTIAALALVAAAATGFLITGLRMHHSYNAALAACAPLNACDGSTPATRALGAQFSQLQRSYEPMFLLLELLVLAVPALIGIFWGAPLIGRELETGTHQLAWGQTVTRTRWLAVKLVVVGAASVVTAAVFSWLLTWWAGPLDHLNGDRWAAMTFASRDIVPLGYAAFAFALGTTAGLLLRRALPAMAVTLAAFIAIQIFVPTVVREHLLPPETVSVPINQQTVSRAQGIGFRNGSGEISLLNRPVPPGSWVIAAPAIRDSSGHEVTAATHPDCFPGFDSDPGSNPAPGDGAPDFADSGGCLAKYDLHATVSYQPAGRYWPLQWIETGIFLVLAGVLAGTCFWWIRRRPN
jgi:hypothetical protein